MMRQIIIPSANNHTFEFPKLYYGKKVILTVLAFNETADSFTKAEEARDFFNSIQVDMTGFKFDREEANER